MSLIYPAEDQTIGQAIAELEELGGAASINFEVTRDHDYKTVLDVDDELYEKWRKKHESTSDTSDVDSADEADATSDKAADSGKDTKSKSRKGR